jgi:dCMP deaminase
MNWDKYFHKICGSVASKSPCFSRKIGAILVKDNSIISTGYNGPPRGVPHCGPERSNAQDDPNTYCFACPRKIYGFKSGEGLEYCPAVHAEMNAVIDAARKGASTLGTTLYMNCVVSCKQCMGILMNAGVVEVVVESEDHYDELTKFFSLSSNFPAIRLFNLEE